MTRARFDLPPMPGAPHFASFSRDVCSATKVSFHTLHREPLPVKSSGIPHLVNNLRAVGHPASVAGPKGQTRKRHSASSGVFCVSDGAVRYGSRPILAGSSAVASGVHPWRAFFDTSCHRRASHQVASHGLHVRSRANRSPLVSIGRQVRRLSSAHLRDGRSIAAPTHGSSLIRPVR